MEEVGCGSNTGLYTPETGVCVPCEHFPKPNHVNVFLNLTKYFWCLNLTRVRHFHNVNHVLRYCRLLPRALCIGNTWLEHDTCRAGGHEILTHFMPTTTKRCIVVSKEKILHRTPREPCYRQTALSTLAKLCGGKHTDCNWLNEKEKQTYVAYREITHC